MEHFLISVDPGKTLLVETEESRFILHKVKSMFYTRRVQSKDPRYCLVTHVGGKKQYTEKDFDLGVEFYFIHPRLEREVSSGRITSVAVR